MRQETGGETCSGSSSDSATGLEGIRMLHCHATARGEGRNVADTRGNQAVSEDHKGADHQDEGAWFSWLSRLPVTQEAADSSLVAPASAHASLDCSTFRGPRGTCRAVALFDDKQATNKQASKNRIFILPRAIC